MSKVRQQNTLQRIKNNNSNKNDDDNNNGDDVKENNKISCTSIAIIILVYVCLFTINSALSKY